MAEDIFGNAMPEDDEEPLEDDDAPEAETEAEASEDTDDDATPALQADGSPPTDPAEAKRYWQAAYTKSRQKDRERYGTLEQEHEQYKHVLAQFYQDDAYAMQILRQRFPQLAQHLHHGQSGPAPAEGSTPSDTSGLTARLKQRLGEFGFLADGIGSVLEEEVERRVDARVKPLEQRTVQHTEAARKAEEDRLLSEMDGKYPGWEDNFGAQMQDLDKFLGGDALNHPKFGNKYELYLRLLNPDLARVEASQEMGRAARRRTGLGRAGRSSAPNIDELVRSAESNTTAFQEAARAAMEETRERT